MADEPGGLSELRALVRQGIEATESAISRISEQNESRATKEEVELIRQTLHTLTVEVATFRTRIEGLLLGDGEREGIFGRVRSLEEGRGKISWGDVGKIVGILLSMVGIYIVMTQIIAAGGGGS